MGRQRSLRERVDFEHLDPTPMELPPGQSMKCGEDLVTLIRRIVGNVHQQVAPDKESFEDWDDFEDDEAPVSAYQEVLMRPDAPEGVDQPETPETPENGAEDVTAPPGNEEQA